MKLWVVKYRLCGQKYAIRVLARDAERAAIAVASVVDCDKILSVARCEKAG
ncbi:MAG: hypothetical protein NC078_10235 [Ruminococcus sp.]|nr:hypothetical protein [Ruminococcus sp.]